MVPKGIHLADLADPELDGQEVIADVVIAGIGDTYGVPKKVRFTCVSEKEHICPLNGGSKEVELTLADRRLLNCYGVPDSSLHDALHPPQCAAAEILERYTLRTFLALPKVRKLAAKRSDPFGVVDEKGREFRGEAIYFIDDVDPPGTDGFVALASIPYRAQAVVQTEPKRQRKVLQVTSLQRLEQPWQAFKLTPDVEAGFRRFQVGQGIKAVNAKIDELVRDCTDHITRRYGQHREVILTAELIVMSTPICLDIEGERKPGYGQLLVLGDTGEAKTTTVENFLNAVGLGALATGAAATRTGLTYSLDDRVDERRVLRWGLLPQNNRGLVIVDESHKFSWADWAELTDVRSTGEVRVDRSVRGRHPAEVRQIYLANPPESHPLSHYYAGIEAIKGLMRLEDLRRFDLVVIAAKGDNKKKEYLELDRHRRKGPQLISPDLWHAHLCWAWSLEPGSIAWSDEALEKLVEVSTELDDRYGAATDIPLVGSDIKDKVARLAQGVAALVHSTDDHLTVKVLPEHLEYVGVLMRAIYDHENCRLDEYAQTYRAESELTENEYQQIRGELASIKTHALDPETVDDMMQAFRRSDSLSLDDLVGFLGISRGAIKMRTAVLRKYRLLRSGRGGYKRTPRLIAFLRRLDKDGGKL
jgi:hypothetical protein